MAEKNVEINVKTSTGYDQLYPKNKATIIATADEVPHTIQIRDWITSGSTKYVDIPFAGINANYVPIVNIATKEADVLGCESFGGKVRITGGVIDKTIVIDSMIGIKEVK